MKHLKRRVYTTLFTAIIMGTVSFAQDDVQITSQEEVDDWTATTVVGNLSILTDITNLEGLSELTSVGGNIVISNVFNITSMSGLDNLTSIGGSLNIIRNFSLTSLEGLEKLASITSSLSIRANSKLTTLSGLDGLTSLGNISIGEGVDAPGTSDPNGNLLLSDYCAISSLVVGSPAEVIESDYIVENNGYNPSYSGLGNESVETSDGANDGCSKFLPIILPPTNVRITSQEEVDDWTATTVSGNLSILIDITNLEGLSELTSVGGNILISNVFNITSMSGLDNLTSIGGGFAIIRNFSLTSLEGLEKLASITSSLDIRANSKLTTLSGLDGLTSLGNISIGEGVDAPGTSDPNGNLLLSDYCAISSLVVGSPAEVIESNYTVENNGYNPSYSGLGNESVETSDGANDGCSKLLPIIPINVTITSQEQVDNWTATTVVGNLGILTDITNLEGLSELTSVGGNIVISNVFDITSMSGLDNLTSIGGSLNIIRNYALTSLEGLEKLASITSSLDIRSNSKLTTLSGLDGLTSLGNISIGEGVDAPGTSDPNGNLLLSDYCAISSLVVGSPAEVIESDYIVENNGYNPSYSGLGNESVETSDGANDGCSKLLPILSTNTFSKKEYRLFPNPVTDILYITSESTIHTISIYNTFGQVILENANKTIAMSNFSKGIYLVKIVSGDRVSVEKIIKK